MSDRVISFQHAARQRPDSFWRQTLLFICENKKWWLLPILIVLGIVALLAFVSGSGVAPLIYTIF